MSQLLKWKQTALRAMRQRRPSSLLALSLDGDRLEGVVLRRTNGSVELQQSISATLTLDLLTGAPELVGREIRNHLDAAGVRERRCIMAVPQSLALTLPVKLPDLEETDIANFLQLEAERGFPSDVESLMVRSSRLQLPTGEKSATLVAIPRENLSLLEQVLTAAQLKPVSLTFAITALQRPSTAEGLLALVIGSKRVELQITCGGGVATLRTLEGAFEEEGAHKVLQADHVARDIRITLGQLPAEIRDSIRGVRIFGPPQPARELSDEIQTRLGTLGLKVEVVSSYAPGEFGVALPAGATVSAPFSLAAAALSEHEPVFEFLAPRVSQLQQFAARYSSGKLQKAAVGAGAVVLLVAGAFGVQEWQLMRLHSQWTEMSPKVRELDALQAQVRQFRPWYDQTYRSLSIMKALTAAFPEDGAVFAKTVEIRSPDIVTCSGVARDNQAWLKMLERLRATSAVADLKVDRITGNAPKQFTFAFRWVEGGHNAN